MDRDINGQPAANYLWNVKGVVPFLKVDKGLDAEKEGVQLMKPMNILCMGGRTVGPAVALDLVQTFLAAEFSQASRHLRRLNKVASLETDD